MCILIKITNKESFSKEEFYQAWKSNPDWWWIAFRKNKDKKLSIWKFMSVDEMYSVYERIPLNEWDEIILHFRIWTSWTKDEYNVHPFKLNNKTVLFHNWVIQSPTPRDNMSDTHTLSDNIEKLKLTNDEIFEDDWVIDMLLKHKINWYNKFIIISTSHPAKIYWSNLWHYRDWNWFSNNSYKIYKTPAKIYNFPDDEDNSWYYQDYYKPIKKEIKKEVAITYY